MKIIARPRQTGKTTELILRSHQTNYPIIVPTLKQTELIKKMANEYHLWIPEPIAICDGRSTRSSDPVLLDNADAIIEDILKLYFGRKIDTIVLNV